MSQGRALLNPLNNPEWQLLWGRWHILVHPECAALACTLFQTENNESQQAQEEV